MRQDDPVASEDLRRRRRRAGLVALGGMAVVVVAVAAGGDDGGPLALTGKAKADKPRLVQLPRGGRRIFPGHQVVAYYGAPQDADLGALGIGSPSHAGRRLLGQAGAYEKTSKNAVWPA